MNQPAILGPPYKGASSRSRCSGERPMRDEGLPIGWARRPAFPSAGSRSAHGGRVAGWARASSGSGVVGFSVRRDASLHLERVFPTRRPAIIRRSESTGEQCNLPIRRRRLSPISGSGIFCKTLGRRARDSVITPAATGGNARRGAPRRLQQQSSCTVRS